jgi:hypothetical protein
MPTTQRVAGVTGGTGGLGQAICRRLAGEGFTVVALHTPGNTRVQEWLAAQQAQGYRFDAVEADVASFASCAAAVATIHDRLDPVSVLVNNAGITRDASFRKMTQAESCRRFRGDAWANRTRWPNWWPNRVTRPKGSSPNVCGPVSFEGERYANSTQTDPGHGFRAGRAHGRHGLSGGNRDGHCQGGRKRPRGKMRTVSAGRPRRRLRRRPPRPWRPSKPRYGKPKRGPGMSPPALRKPFAGPCAKPLKLRATRNASWSRPLPAPRAKAGNWRKRPRKPRPMPNGPPGMR